MLALLLLGDLMLPKLNVLVSFAYLRAMKDLFPALCDVTNMLVDSGAFTNYRRVLFGRDETTGLPDYIAGCREWGGQVWNYIALDSIADPVGTDRNLQAMLDAGLRPMPVFVHGAEPEKVVELCGINHDRICVAGGVQTKDKWVHHRYQKAFRDSGKRAKIHALGFVRLPDIYRLPLSTVDSVSYYNGSAFGKVFRYSRRPAGFETCCHRELAAANKPHVIRIKQELAMCGITKNIMFDRAHVRGPGGYPSLFTINSYLNFHQHSRVVQPAYFFASPTNPWMATIVAVAATRRGDLFDYPEARRLYGSLTTEWKQDRKRCSARIAGLIRAHTDLTTGGPNDPLPADDLLAPDRAV